MEHESNSAQPPVTSRPQLSEDETTWAFVIGGGLLLIMLALGLNAIQGPGNSNALSIILPIGLLVAGVGTVFWMIQLRPWKKYEDMSTPYYTGHTEHAQPETHAAHAERQEQQIKPLPPPPVIVDPTEAFSPDEARNETSVTPPVIADPIDAFSPEEAQPDAPKPRKPRAKKTKS